MALHNAHEGYEYQDLLTIYCILRELINENKAEFKIDEKIFEEDKFDDLRILKENMIEQMQVKYSNEDVSYTLSKTDLAAKGNHKIPLDLLFNSWKETNKILEGKNLEYRLCLAWNPPIEDDKIQDVIFENNSLNKTFEDTKIYQVDVNKLWPVGGRPLVSWQRLRTESEKIDREEFREFCNSLIIEVNFPKASLDIERPGQLEKQVALLVEKLGIGKYPNNNININEAILKLAHLVKSVRAKSRDEKIRTNYIISYLNLVTDYGSINQFIKIDQNKNVKTENVFNEYIEKLNDSNKLVVYGNPGSGKSWFVENISEYLEGKGYMTVKHYCYTQLGDEEDYKRIKTSSLYGNLIADILNRFPELKQDKPTKYGVDKSELEYLLNQIQEECVIFIDGLDHIERIYMLNSEKLNRSEISIVEDFATLEIPSNIKVIISTQPIQEESLLVENGYSIKELENWDNEQIKILMGKYNVENIKLETEFLSQMLLAKSNGNPLYLTYLLEEIKKEEFIVKEKIDLLPPYSDNLDEYYKYLLNELEDMLVVNVLCGANFSISMTELKEITGLGEYVEKVISVLRPVLRHNLASGGVIIYHESFRRHIIERLRAQGVMVKKIIYRDLIEWFEEKGFLRHPKAYRYYLPVLLEVGETTKIISLLERSFVVDSYYYGYPKKLVEGNYKIFLKAVTIQMDFEKVVLLSEMGNQLASTISEVEANYGLYFQALGHVHGFEQLKSCLVYEDKPVFSQEIGLKGCYICSENGVMPNWDAYLFLNDTISIENYKYFIRGIFDSNNDELIRKEMLSISDSELNAFKEQFVQEYINHHDLEYLKNEIQKLNDLNWEKFIKYYEGKFSVSQESAEYSGISKDVLDIRRLREEEIEVVTNLFNQINLAIIKQEFDEIKEFIEELKGRNWFFNWLIFTVELKLLQYESISGSKENLEEKVKEYFNLLELDTNPFKGEPRVVDLHNITDLIHQTFKDGLSLINTKETWNYIIDILNNVSIKTSSRLQGSLVGPLSSEKLIELLCNNIKPENIEKVIEIINYYQDGEENQAFYSYLAEYAFRISILYSKTNQAEQAEHEYNKAITYLTSYTFHKDRTLDQLIDSFDSINALDSTLANTYIYKINTLVNTVLSHTNGKETRWYPIYWYEKFVNLDYKNALLFFRSRLLESTPNRITEKMLIGLITKIPETQITEKCLLLRTFPNKMSDEFIKLYIDLIYKLDELDYSHMARVSFSDLISRFDFQSLNLKDISKKNISKMYWLAKSLNYNCEKLERWFIIKNSIIEKQEDNNYLQNGIIHRKRFSDMSTQEFIIYFEKNILVEEDMNSFIYYLSSNAYEDDELKYIIKTLICRNERFLGRNEHIKNLKKSFEVFLSNDLKAYMLTCVFCVEEDGWLNRFVNIDVFAEAYELDKEITINTLFECIYEHLERMGYHNSIGSYLINALTKINYDKEMVKNMWGELYNIISFRLPEKIELNWDKILQNDFEMDNTELLQSIVLTRLNHGELVRQKIIISGISYLMEREIQKLQKPLKWFFSNKDKFTNISIILILQLILEQDDYSNEELKGTLLEIYPVPNYMINILLEEICEVYIENKPKLPQVQVNYKPTEKQKEMLKVQHTEVGKIDRAGLDISQITAQFYKKIYGGLGEEIGRLFYNRAQKILIPNIYEKDIIISIINEELYEYDNNGLLDDYDELELYCCVAPDIKTIVAYENTLSIRPQNMLRPKQYQQDIFENYIKDADRQWVRLAYWEEELVKRNYTSFEIHEVLQGIVFCEEKLSLPVGHLYTKDIWGYPEILCVNNEKPICMDMFSDSFINYRILWLNPLFIKLLGLKVKSMNCGLSAVNEQEEVVLLLKSWKTSYLGNDEFPSYELPCLKGNELVIREDYFEKLCSIIGKAPKKQLIKKSYKI